jgi:hypothetical protein
MNISFLDPLVRAWHRARTMLFGGLDVGGWFVLGFSAWVAGLADGRNSTSGLDLNWKHGGQPYPGFPDLATFIHRVQESAPWIFLAVFGGLVALVIGILLLWLSSRAKFVFLDNVLHRRAQMVDPWNRYARLGDSLFLWRLVFSALVFLVVLGVIIPVILATGIGTHFGWSDLLTGGMVILLVFSILLIVIPVAYVQLLLDDFIVPIMYSRNISTTAAWGVFLPLFRREFVYFILYGFLVLVLWIGVALGITFLGLATCCVGFLILAIPYINSVVLLPVSVTYRAYSVEFLGQFGGDFALIPAVEASEPPSPRP